MHGLHKSRQQPHVLQRLRRSQSPCPMSTYRHAGVGGETVETAPVPAADGRGAACSGRSWGDVVGEGRPGSGGVAGATSMDSGAGGTSSSTGGMNAGGMSTDGGAPVRGCYACDSTTGCGAICGDMGGACSSPGTCGKCSTTTGCCTCTGTNPGPCRANSCPAKMRCTTMLPGVPVLSPLCGSGDCRNDAVCANWSLSRCCLGSPRVFNGTSVGYCANTCP
jgi:hypothetical protein